MRQAHFRVEQKKCLFQRQQGWHACSSKGLCGFRPAKLLLGKGSAPKYLLRTSILDFNTPQTKAAPAPSVAHTVSCPSRLCIWSDEDENNRF